MKARGPISGLIGSVGVLILGLAVLAYWCTIGLYVFMFIFGTGGGEASGIPLGFALIAFPFVHGFAELLVYLGFDDCELMFPAPDDARGIHIEDRARPIP
jgi:hypothetical protein